MVTSAGAEAAQSELDLDAIDRVGEAAIRRDGGLLDDGIVRDR